MHDTSLQVTSMVETVASRTLEMAYSQDTLDSVQGFRNMQRFSASVHAVEEPRPT